MCSFEFIHLLLQPSLTPLGIWHYRVGGTQNETTTLPVKGSGGYCLDFLKGTHLP